MKIQFFTPETLTHRQRSDMKQLAQACRQAEPITLSIPEDGDGFFFAYGNDPDSHLSIKGCLVFCIVQEDLWECYAFTHPDSRRQGIFTCLLEELCQKAAKQEEASKVPISLVFLLDGKSPHALAAANSLEMEFWYSEYQMELSLLPIHQDPPASSPLFLIKRVTNQDSQTIGEPVESWTFYAYITASGGILKRRLNETGMPYTDSEPIGSCRLIPFQNSAFYLYDVEIKKELRGNGLGEQLLSALFSQLPKGSRIRLQVSSQNQAAFSLYKKAGFGITETLSYYEYLP